MSVNTGVIGYMVGGVGFEPTHPEGTDLQSAAALQLYRPPVMERMTGIEPE